MLPSVPGIIKVNDNPKLREQTETDMIKRLIVSYFNVVKKNVNDSIPKAIVTFLVNHCRNSCEKILVNNLYVEDLFQELLLEQDYVVKEREKLNQELHILKDCLGQINSLDSQLSLWLPFAYAILNHITSVIDNNVKFKMGAACISAKSSAPHLKSTSLQQCTLPPSSLQGSPSNPESIFTSPVKASAPLRGNNSKLIWLSASPCNSSEMTIGKLPPSLPEDSMHPIRVNSVFTVHTNAQWSN